MPLRPSTESMFPAQESADWRSVGGGPAARTLLLHGGHKQYTVQCKVKVILLQDSRMSLSCCQHKYDINYIVDCLEGMSQ